MAFIRGGEFWVGSEPSEHFSDDESPRFLTRVASFCLDRLEVTAGEYGRCVNAGGCEAANSSRYLCNGGRIERQEHPINCVTHQQAVAACRHRAARLPTEVEWEYAARGGERALRYPWGDAAPDGRACWKEPRTCPVMSYPADAYGIYDLSGNVWEWTDTWYGPYPFPPKTGFAKVYRGGSFSRRFEKWMHTRLRNRQAPESWGAHLGFRCAATLPAEPCPFGRDAAGECRFDVVSRDCPGKERWNGVRCAPPGAERCRPGRVEEAGFGCVVAEPEAPPERDLEAEARGVRRQRTAQFDGDCRAIQPQRPRAFRYAGGTSDARTAVAQQDGCKNRDVGVGWNSDCCP